VLDSEGELAHALAPSRLYSDGAQVLYDYSWSHEDPQLLLRTVVESDQAVFHDVIESCLDRISFGSDPWAVEMVLPITRRRLLRAAPSVAQGDPLFTTGGAPLSAVISRAKAGEPLGSIARDHEVPIEDIHETLEALRTPQAA
jgi:uncharacterized protein (DUF433 family)